MKRSFILTLAAAMVLVAACRKKPIVVEAPSGPECGSVGAVLTFSSSATDPAEESVSVRFDWGDGDTSGWSAWLASGATITDSHSWSALGTYNLRAQAKNTAGNISDWSGTLVVPIVQTWTRTFGGPGNDYGAAVVVCADGGYVVTGTTYSFGAGLCDIYLVKTNAAGDTVWTRTFGGADYDYAQSVQSTTDGGYIVAGTLGNNVYLIKTDSLGNKIWHNTLGIGQHMEPGQKVLQAKDGGYVVLGRNNTVSTLTKTDASGNLSWVAHIDVYGEAVIETDDGRFVVAGDVKEPGTISLYDVGLATVDALGNQVWAYAYPRPGSPDHGWALQPTADGGYLIAGESGGRVFLVKADAMGAELWVKESGGPGDAAGRAIQATADGGYVITGYVVNQTTMDDIYLLGVNANGDSLWAAIYGGANDDFGYSVRQTADRGLVVCGSTRSYGAGTQDIWLVRTDARGNVEQ
ncbi:hypothetical protein JXD38_04170 [candidate division WOR-3 bacterium]|nr:hypothetical protein [candidate division WOR-3 bacterium]